MIGEGVEGVIGGGVEAKAGRGVARILGCHSSFDRCEELVAV